MSNLKKILALVLALVMSFSLVTVSSAALKDSADIDEAYAEAAQVLMALDIVKGDNGKFNPKNDITRAEVAALIYRIHTGDVKDERVAYYVDAARFTDEIPVWAKGYVGYCAANGLIKGYADGSFQANGKVTGFEALTMILRAIGYDKLNEFTGINWSTNAASRATQLGITDNVKPGALVGPATREVVAEILFRAMITNQANYTPALGYVESTIIETRLSLGEQNFDLAEVVGMVTDYNHDKDTVEFRVETENGVVYMNVVGSGLTWENVGFAAKVWTINTAKAKTFTALVPAVVLGEVMFEATNNYTHKYIVEEKINGMLDNFWVVYNGEIVGGGMADYAINAIGRTGVKVQYVDNDWMLPYGGGMAEAVIVTEYFATKVTGIANESNTGFNAWVPGYIYFGTAADGVKEENVICETELNVGDVVTYVQHDDEYYVTVAESMEKQAFSRIDHNMDFETERKYDTYTLGGVAYEMSSRALSAAKTNLVRANLTKNYNVWFDSYGYVINAEEFVNVEDYLYIVRHNHSDNVLGTTLATVVFAKDATVSNVLVSDASRETFNTIAEDMYSFEEKEGYLALGKTCLTDKNNYTGEAGVTSTLNYTKGNSWLAKGAYLTKNSVVIDVRTIGRTDTTATVYTGYNEVPSLNGAVFHYLTDKDGFVIFAFLSDGTPPTSNAGYTLEFIAYRTDAWYNAADKTYTLPAIVAGEYKEVVLSDDQYADVQALGVGVYKYVYATKDDKAPKFTFTAFNEVWDNVIWKEGALALITGDKAYTYDDADFMTLNITKGLYHDFVMNYGSDVHAYVVTAKAPALDQIYLIYGDEATTASTYYTKTSGGYDYTYLVDDGKITMAVKTEAEEEEENEIDVAIKEVEDAIAALEKLLKDNGLELAAVEVDASYRDLTLAILNAYADVVEALNELKGEDTEEATAEQFAAVSGLIYKVENVMPKQLMTVCETIVEKAIKAAVADIKAAAESEDEDEIAAANANAKMAQDLLDDLNDSVKTALGGVESDLTIIDVIDDPDDKDAFDQAVLDVDNEDIPALPEDPEEVEVAEIRAAALEDLKDVIKAAITADDNAKLIKNLNTALAATELTFDVGEEENTTFAEMYESWTGALDDAEEDEEEEVTLAEALAEVIEDLEDEIEATVKALGEAMKAATYVTATFAKGSAAVDYDEETKVLTVPAGVTLTTANVLTGNYLTVNDGDYESEVTVKDNTITVKVEDPDEELKEQTYVLTWENEEVKVALDLPVTAPTNVKVTMKNATTGTITLDEEELPTVILASVFVAENVDGVDETVTFAIDKTPVTSINFENAGQTLTIKVVGEIDDVKVAETIYTFTIVQGVVPTVTP